MITLSFRPRLVLALCAAAAIAASIPHGTRAAVGPLLAAVPQDQLPAGLQAAAAPWVRRSQYVTVDLAQLRAPGQRVMLREPAVTLELLPGVTVFAQFERYDPSSGGMTWVGRVEGIPQSTVTLAYGGGLLAGTVVMRDAVYHVRPAGAGNLHVVEQVDQAALPREAEPVEVSLSAEQLAASADAPMGDAADEIDLMVVYTPLAAAHAGGPAGITNLINLGVSETNTSYANSGVNQRVRLVHAGQVPYVESSNFSTNLNALRSGTGGLTAVPGLRDAVGADLVKLLVHPSAPSACGVAFIMTVPSTAFAPNAFSVTDTGCVSPNFTFAHEMGHNMGIRHDWYMDGGTTPFTYAHGYVNPNVGQRWRTIMAYPDMCSALGFSCTRVLNWANPDQRYLPFCDSGRFNCGQLQYWYYPGAPMGVPAGTGTNCQAGNRLNPACDADDRRALNDTAPFVANFRQRVADRTVPR